MKKQFEAVWMTTDGNRHELWPIYANNETEARTEAVDWMCHRHGKYAVIDSLKLRTT